MKTHWRASRPYPNEISQLRNELAIPAIGLVFRSSAPLFPQTSVMSDHQGEESSSGQRLEKGGGEEGWRDAMNAAAEWKSSQDFH